MEGDRQSVSNIYSKQYKMLKYLALWNLPSDSSSCANTIFKIYFWCFFIFWILLFDFVMIIQVLANFGSVREVIKVLFMLGTAIAVLCKIVTVKLKNQSYENYFKSLFLEKFLPHSTAERKLFMESIELNTKVHIFYRNVSYAACGSFIMSQYISDTKDLPVSIYSPLDLNVKWKYNVMYVYECFALSTLCWTNVAFDTLSSSFLIHLKGQLDILGYRLECIGRNNTNVTQDLIFEELRVCVRFYNQILELAHDIEHLISKPMSLQIACSVFVLVANFYAMSLVSRLLKMLGRKCMYVLCVLYVVAER